MYTNFYANNNVHMLDVHIGDEMNLISKLLLLVLVRWWTS